MIRVVSMHFDTRIVRTRGSVWGGSVLAFREDASESAAPVDSTPGGLDHGAPSEPA